MEGFLGNKKIKSRKTLTLELSSQMQYMLEKLKSHLKKDQVLGSKKKKCLMKIINKQTMWENAHNSEKTNKKESMNNITC